MTDDRRCPRCGAPLDSQRDDSGPCPACLMELALDVGDDDEPSPPTDDDPGLAPGDRIGPYVVERKLGEGGMGVVYLAKQSAPLERLVALKVIKRGMETKQVVARFEIERQALAAMDHPSIAAVHDAGATDDGRPYFVMEYIDGTPINRYCDEHRLTTVERLELLAKVCEGVQHAHRRGIIHRDLKPSNVLVVERDGEALPRIIDFGVAKATEQRIAERSVFTEFGVLIGTPEYMSPEQADLSPLDVDTRTDVYSLGVMLYELLTGALPFEPSELRAAAFDEVRRRIREENPSRPSTRISELGERATGNADRRRSDPSTLRRRLSGDLDVITMKALEKEAARRYESPAELAADIRRHLTGDPVLARAPGAWYLARRFVARHRLPAALSALVLLLLVVFGVWMTVLYRQSQAHLARALDAETEAETVSDFLIGVFEVSDPGTAPGEEPTARALLDGARRRIAYELEDRPGVRATLLGTLGRVYGSLGHYDRSLELAEETLRTTRDAGGEIGPALAAVGSARYHLGEFDEAEALLGQALESLDEDDVRTRATIYELFAGIRWQQGRYDEALEHAKTMERLRQEAFGAGSIEDADSQLMLSNVWLALGDGEKTIETAERAHAIFVEVLDENHPRALEAQNNLAELFRRSGRFERAEALFLDIIEREREVYEEDHPKRAYAYNNLAIVLRRLGRPEEAVERYREAIRIREAALPENHPLLAWTWDNLGLALLDLKRFDEAEAAYERARRIALAAVGRDSPDYAVILNNTALMWRDRGDDRKAEALLREAIAIHERTVGPEHERLADPLYTLGNLLAQRGDLAAGLEMLRRSLDVTVATYGPDHPDAVDTRGRIDHWTGGGD